MDSGQLYAIIDEGGNPGASDIYPLKALVEEYPFFQAATFLYLKSLYLHENENFETELKRLAIFVSDRKALFYHIFSDEYKVFFEQTGKKEIKEDKTGILLNAFFENREDLQADADLEYSISHSSLASSDYFTYVNAMSVKELLETAPAETITLKHQSIIDSFIEKSKEEGGIRIQIDNDRVPLPDTMITAENAGDEELDEDMFFTETLAKIYIKQKKYEKAYKIIKHLSLNYPKKNIYFADQLSFLEKLIINSKFKDKK